MNYDLVVVVDANANGEQMQTKLSTLLEKEGFTISGLTISEKKELEYPIKKITSAVIYSCIISGNRMNSTKLRNKLHLEESVLRTLLLLRKKGGKAENF